MINAKQARKRTAEIRDDNRTQNPFCRVATIINKAVERGAEGVVFEEISPEEQVYLVDLGYKVEHFSEFACYTVMW